MLSRERIVVAAVELLDTAGEGALTVRTLSERLATGSGAIYHHVGRRNELLQAAIETVIGDALAATGTGAGGTPEDEVRAAALALFDAVTEHPWLAAQLAVQITRNPWGAVTLRVFESIGRPMLALGVPRRDWFATTSTLVHYILGATTQNSQAPQGAGGGAAPGGEAGRAEFLDAAARAWQDVDPGDYPFVRAIAGQMREHDDRRQFRTGIDLVLKGITAAHPPVKKSRGARRVP
ncbi:TetR/AcrR family transcriptional regulator [Amycolatopsis sp. MEPSY49]|uniref:TetR/AcrR family transcriptional regulator n=1 Tax=Amycolatopsis sp. MEPSY49 TaxID=3151600 RepID=UPI003EF15AA3